jgi:hypothetical protein
MNCPYSTIHTPQADRMDRMMSEDFAIDRGLMPRLLTVDRSY